MTRIIDRPMALVDVYDHLCWHDPRHPGWDDLTVAYDDDPPPARSDDCACDNCFYGRDRLAQEILRLKAQLDTSAPSD